MELKLEEKQKELIKLVSASAVIGLACGVLGDTLKLLTEKYEARFFSLASRYQLLYFVFPFLGLSAIYILRRYLFKRKANKGIKEIYASLETRHNELPAYKIPSHFVNGILTLVFGGSSGIEVSTVVASASIGSVTHRKSGIHALFRKEIICAGVAAGVTALFGSPLAGILFALEVILKKAPATAILSTLAASAFAWLFSVLSDSPPVFVIHADRWNYSALPYFIVLGVFAGFHSAYLTRSVFLLKRVFSRFARSHTKALVGALCLGSCILAFPQLYGDGYEAMREIFHSTASLKLTLPFIASLLALIVLKPLATSITLAAGGDGGIFGPSLFIGAFAGLFVSLLLNSWFGLALIPVNFMVAGMAAMLSASLHAPLTAVALVCGLVGNFNLLIPVLLASLVAKLVAKWLLPYTVYSYAPPPEAKAG